MYDVSNKIRMTVNVTGLFATRMLSIFGQSHCTLIILENDNVVNVVCLGLKEMAHPRDHGHGIIDAHQLASVEL